MRKQLFTNPFQLLFGCIALMVVFFFYLHITCINANTAAVDCPENIQTIEGPKLLWESLSRQFVYTATFK